MLLNKLTVTLASFVSILAFGLVFATGAVWADDPHTSGHEHPGITISVIDEDALVPGVQIIDDTFTTPDELTFWLVVTVTGVTHPSHITWRSGGSTPLTVDDHTTADIEIYPKDGQGMALGETHRMSIPRYTGFEYSDRITISGFPNGLAAAIAAGLTIEIKASAGAITIDPASTDPTSGQINLLTEGSVTVISEPTPGGAGPSVNDPPADITGQGTPNPTPTPTPPSVPGPPTAVIATVDDALNTITLTWTAPAEDGGSPITDYFVMRYYGTPEMVQEYRAFTATTVTLPVLGEGPLAQGVPFTFTVRAVNAQGTGMESARSGSATLMVDGGTGNGGSGNGNGGTPPPGNGGGTPMPTLGAGEVASKGYAVLTHKGATAADTGISGSVQLIAVDMMPDLYEFE